MRVVGLLLSVIVMWGRGVQLPVEENSCVRALGRAAGQAAVDIFGRMQRYQPARKLSMVSPGHSRGGCTPRDTCPLLR